MKRLLIISGLASSLALGAQAQNTNLVIPPGKIAVFKAGDGTGYWNISTSRVQPCFVQVFDPVTANQAAPLYSLPLPTNAPNGIWINAHAGSEGGGISRAANREFLALEGYTGNILSPTNAKPSAAVGVTRGFGIVDAFGNEQVLYQNPANWFGLPPGVTQNNPTGIATTDGTNFWGTGNVTGTSVEASGVLFYNASVSATPIEIENYIQAAAEARIIGGALYVVVPGGGVYNFLNPANDGVAPLPADPNAPNSPDYVLTNLFLNWGTTYKNIANFDMNAAGTIAYGADQTFGIVKFTNNNGAWQQAYLFNTTNLGTQLQKAGQGGCFGICVDFSGTNPIIYATTMEYGTAAGLVNDSQGNPNQNRLLRIVDTGNPGSSALVAQTLATAATTNEVFRGIDFTPDLTPFITSLPANYATTNGGSATFSITAQSVYPLSYQWMDDGTNLSGETNASLALSDLGTNSNGDTIQCVVSNQWGVVTSTPPAVLTVTLLPVLPSISSPTVNVTGYINGQTTFAPVSATGTEPFTFQWYYGGAPLTDGVKYAGSASPSLTISNLALSDSGSYSVVVSNAAGPASNLVDVLSVQYHLATITAGEPVSVTTFAGLSTSLTATSAGGTPPLTNQWYQITKKATNVLSDANEISGSQTSTLTISPAASGDAGSYKIVVSNGGGSVTSQVATVTVLVPPPYSFVAYSNQVYVQNFNSLPDPGSSSVNSINNPLDPGSIDGISYSLANPFDFAYPVIQNSYVGGLGLSNTMPGWYGAADTLYPGVDGISRFGAQDGDQTTGGVIDFGPNDGNGIVGTNRALGLLSTSTTGSTTFALKLVNQSTNTLNYASLSFIGELWHNGTGSRVMSVGYTLDPTATNFVLTAESISNAVLLSNLFFSFPTAVVVTTVDGTQPANQIDLSTNNVALATSWTPGGALWLIWSLNFYGSGSGNGYAIDNLNFYATSTTNVTVLAAPTLNGVEYTGSGTNAGLQFSFVSTPGASANFTVWSTTNLALPLSQWQNLGNPTEVSVGSYHFLDPLATNNPATFYQVTGSTQ